MAIGVEIKLDLLFLSHAMSNGMEHGEEKYLQRDSKKVNTVTGHVQ
jgi:hypothetical protein